MALDLLAQAINRKVRERNLTPAVQDGWLDMVTDMASVLPYSDACPEDHTDDGERGIVPPHAVHIDQERWLTGRYYCPVHERLWTCGYAVGATPT